MRMGSSSRPVRERELVELTIQRPASLAKQTYGMIGWSGDADAFERLFNESETDRLEPL